MCIPKQRGSNPGKEENTMKYIFTDHKGGSRRELTEREARERLTDRQIAEGRQAMLEDPNEEVSYMTSGGTIHFELD